MQLPVMLPFQVQRWFHGQWFSMWIHTAEETDVWPLLFKSSACVICSWLMPASIFRRDIDSPWPCPWAYVFLWIPSWLFTKAQRQSVFTGLPTSCPIKHTICELAFKILHVAFFISSWPWVWTMAFHAVCFCSLWNDNALCECLSIIGCLYYILRNNVTISAVTNLWHPFSLQMIERFPHILNSK